ncbi:hypothetical protein Anapl_11331 [Anas platyrhynchos]|uniref:Uncharacterized protein n=1 Tax=Anas platyrhynchos TaxID=8839 RepID=R0JAU5_ANAPL|nr:hypothetical protein Anapl_11331 [Anas platyrhynchos]
MQTSGKQQLAVRFSAASPGLTGVLSPEAGKGEGISALCGTDGSSQEPCAWGHQPKHRAIDGAARGDTGTAAHYLWEGNTRALWRGECGERTCSGMATTGLQGSGLMHNFVSTTSSRCPGVHRQRPGKIPGPAHRSLTGASLGPALAALPLATRQRHGATWGPILSRCSQHIWLPAEGQTHACVAFPASFQLVLIMCLNMQRELFLRWGAERSRLRSLPANFGLLRSPPSASARARSKVHVLHFYAVPER